MSSNVPDYVLTLLSSFGDITHRTMFGGRGIFCKGVFFAYYINETLYLRAGRDGGAQFKLMGLQCYRAANKNGLSKTRLYPVPQAWLWEPSKLFLDEVKKSLEEATRSQSDRYRHKKNPQRVRDLANMTLTKERMLKTVGILSVSELISSGPALSFVLLSQSYSNLSYRLLYELEGAINNNYWSVVSVERRKELVSELEVLNSIAAKGDVRQAQTEAYQAAHN
ncbi:TfoX/Sxy family DNA transformation protein [Vibrio parahaemolyticus]|uniref:TfoX/Sxy family DNA transformation protein n=1 Tax=Vibrio parahaemolyticus TaxID=670 RepID=A0A9Q3UIV5_VIBPH|nr:TfoX/Sxy family DNA transformation protein [Vibrio parahaemolyticus]EGQ7800803.1 TfoX/Sxy family DNA transformation protein [Vibrio parahaemolyticus]EGQ8112903.1 TfoX/Sxy family DNA transformation protein [Vibrio parahaemolyticus]EGQ8200633.1 TfoX/Sxy family DNA transformation protein [Vibrio parahaemolyticus]EGQ8551326.1 hypothetical protein [Vibrio parahaemolyticus]EGQ9074905.1 hypothetical protein [Vibrio parahaemolyticus]